MKKALLKRGNHVADTHFATYGRGPHPVTEEELSCTCGGNKPHKSWCDAEHVKLQVPGGNVRKFPRKYVEIISSTAATNN